MLLAIDIGNSSVKVGLFHEDRLYVNNIPTHPFKTSQEYIAIINGFMSENRIYKIPEDCIISSVVPKATKAIVEAVESMTGVLPHLVNHETVKGIKFDILHPEELGADRLAEAKGAMGIYGVPCVVVDFGTATTVNIIDKGNVFRGGAILPGLGLMAGSLGTGTAKLPEIDIIKPENVIGRDTKGAMLSGIIYGTAGAVERLIEEAGKNRLEAYEVIITGGFAGIMADIIKIPFIYDEHLTLKGMNIIYKEIINA